MFAVDYIQKGPYNLILSFRIPLLGVPKVEESIFKKKLFVRAVQIYTIKNEKN